MRKAIGPDLNVMEKSETLRFPMHPPHAMPQLLGLRIGKYPPSLRNEINDRIS
jgi:hypothetical protein